MQERYKNGPATSSGLAAASRHLRRTSALVLATLGLSVGARAQQTTPYFRADAEARSAAAVSPLAAALTRSQALTLDDAALRAVLATAPPEGQAGAPLELALPRPDGSIARFAVRETSVMAPELARKFPSIKTYAGAGLDDPSASLRLDLTPQGFHAQVLTSGGNTYYIDPVSRTDTRHYLGFFRQDMNRAAAGPVPSCDFAPTTDELKESRLRVAAAVASGKTLASGSQVRTYRLALSNTPEYALTKGNTVASVLAGEVTTVNRVVGVYEKELAVRLVLVANNDQLVFLSGIGTQPSPVFSNSNGPSLLGQNQSNVDRIIGTANYDIGHVVSTGGGGIAGLGVVCSSTRKANGVTGLPNPVGDAFDIDYVAHEMGHQFAGNHPFNGNAGSCAGGNRNATTAYEPGSGTTIMAYAGICTSTNDLQAHSDATFHTGNYQEMRAFITTTATCGTTSATGNTAPVVTAPAGGKTLPIGTPFKLTATATDADNDPLTYMWEELDLGTQKAPNDAQAAGDNVPLFRSFVPLLDGTRYFPRLTDLVSNTTVIGERLPTVTRTLKFRCTARDQHSSPVGVIGGIDYSATLNLNVTSTAGPFVISAPNTAVSWTGGTAQTVTWNVAGTDAAPVSCATVNLRLSLDGGLTYPVLLASGVPNNGTASVTVPNVTAAQARVMVEAADNYFFDISDVNFAIAPGPGATITSFTPTSGPVGTVVTLTGTNFTGATAVSINGTAATFTVVSATSLTATVAAGTTSGLISVTTPAGTAVSATPFVVGVPPTITSFTPATGAVGSTVVITGTNFTAASQVTFGGISASVYSVNSATQITVVVPIGAVTGPIAVTTPLGTGTSATSFTIPAAPAITSFSPAAGVPGTVVTINGTNFTGATQVTFNGTVATVFTVVSATQITATVPTGATTGLITVTAPNGIAVSATRFIVQVPTITSFTPPNGPAGTVVTINGNYFNGATQVTFNGTASVFTVVSVAKITATVPVGATSGLIIVTSPTGSGTSATPFLIPPANDLCANAIPLACGQTLNGSNLGATATGDPTAACTTPIRNGGVFYSIVGTGGSMTVTTCNPITDFDTQLFVFSGTCGTYVCVGGNDDAIPNSVTCSSVTFTSQYGVTYRVLVNGYLTTDTGTFGLSLTCATPPAAPAITSLSPTSGPTGSTVTATGSNFTGATGATINGVAVTGFTVVNATTVTFVVPAGATTGNVVITTATGIPSNGMMFTVTVLATARAQQSEFSVYPNPVAGRGTLNLKLAATTTAAQVTLRTVLGQVVATRTFSGSATELPMSGLAAGTYLLTVQAAGRAPSVQRVVVE